VRWLVVLACACATTPAPNWVATWTAAPQRANPPMPITDATLRLVVRTSLGGPRLRVRLSNQYGTAPLAIDRAHVALRIHGGAIDTRTDRALAFGGSASVTVPAGGTVESDPVTLAIPDFVDVAVSLHVPGPASISTGHAVAQAESYLAAGEGTANADASSAQALTSWPIISYSPKTCFWFSTSLGTTSLYSSVNLYV